MMNLYDEYYTRQAGLRAYKKNIYFRHDKIAQHGAGVGGVFSSVYRYLKPFVASGLDVLKDETIRTASDLFNGVVNQKPIKEVLADRGVELADKMRNTAVKKIKSLRGGCIEKKPLKRPRKQVSNQSLSGKYQEKSLCNIKKKRKLNKKDIFE